MENKDDVSKFKDYSGSSSASPVAAPEKKPEVEEKRSCPASMERPSSTPDLSFAGAGRVIASPLAKKTATENSVDLTKVKGSGPNDRIIKSDVDQARQATAPSMKMAAPQIITPSSSQYEDIPLTNIRKVIADRLSFSKQNIPHYYVTVSVNVDNLLKLRTKLNAMTKTKISVNDMVIKAASLACVKVPATNSSWLGEAIRTYKNVNMCVAV